MNPDLIRKCEYIVPNLIPGEEYMFQVSAVNAAGAGEPTIAKEKVN